MRVDVHQHIWTQPLVEALEERDSLPFVRRRDGVAVLHCVGEQPCVIDLAAEAPERRAALVRSDGLELAVIALSSPAGIEALPRSEAQSLIAAHLDGVTELDEEFAAWGPVALDRPDRDEVDELLERGCVGISVPAGAIAGVEATTTLGPLLDAVAERGVPLFVHPGRAPGCVTSEASPSEPLWWPALTHYVAQMHAAWLTFTTLVRREHPDLVAVFAMLAGAAPLQAERLAIRGGPTVDLRDPNVFYDTSSYGAGAVGALARRVGSRQLVYGSDRPVVEPSAVDRDAPLMENGARLLERVPARI